MDLGGQGPLLCVGICGCNQSVVTESAGTINGFIRKMNKQETNAGEDAEQWDETHRNTT